MSKQILTALLNCSWQWGTAGWLHLVAIYPFTPI